MRSKEEIVAEYQRANPPQRRSALAEITFGELVAFAFKATLAFAIAWVVLGLPFAVLYGLAVR